MKPALPSTNQVTTTKTIVDALSKAIVEHRLLPGAKLGEQKLADHFNVSRTLIRQALFQLSQKRLIRMEPARGAFVASPSAEEARQVFGVRRMLEAEMTREFVQHASDRDVQALRDHVAQELRAVEGNDVPARADLLGDFHVRMAHLLGNQVLAQVLGDLLSRCTLITLIFQTRPAAEHSVHEHLGIVDAISQRDALLAVRLMEAHLNQVVANLALDSQQPTRVLIDAAR